VTARRGRQPTVAGESLMVKPAQGAISIAGNGLTVGTMGDDSTQIDAISCQSAVTCRSTQKYHWYDGIVWIDD
jgi:hypothetical protein